MTTVRHLALPMNGGAHIEEVPPDKVMDLWGEMDAEMAAQKDRMHTLAAQWSTDTETAERLTRRPAQKPAWGTLSAHDARKAQEALEALHKANHERHERQFPKRPPPDTYYAANLVERVWEAIKAVITWPWWKLTHAGPTSIPQPNVNPEDPNVRYAGQKGLQVFLADLKAGTIRTDPNRKP